ncbi:unnamed protein product [Clonostachys chloroleuca]|uniref:Uncharacterized protein n=1 Tax=Clonostachys chloroleuca TaxID=1926264 RepID=A0AA35VDD2_9HYPO|nr:unnamed protein product [Clonostachys chloroleuca]
MKFSTLLASLVLGEAVAAQSFVSLPKDINVTLSQKFPGARITYKEVKSICETTQNVRSYSGHISLPKDLIPDATGWGDGVSGHLHFWYFEARNNATTAPTSIYLGGGPGYSSFDGSAVFPCYFNADGNSTTLNEHSWNNHVNMLYIDQPFGVGYSYTTALNGTLNTLDQSFSPVTTEAELPQLNLTTIQGTLHAGGPETVANTTMSAARTFWSFVQVWFNEFPERITTNDELSIWAVSYGGLYAPLFASHFLDQNELIKNGTHEVANATAFNMATVGIINGLVEMSSMLMGFPDYARNNTFGLPVYSEDVYQEVVKNITAPEQGCLALIDQCRAVAPKGDPENKGNNDDVNKVCSAASQFCFGTILQSFERNAPYGYFDITYNRPATYPYEYEAAFFNQAWVQQELGVPLNYTRGSQAVEAAFLRMTGDPVRYGFSHLTHLLDGGVNIAMVYGDRDYRCNWISAENASLSIPFQSAEDFAKAGYESITTNSSYQGGLVREHGKLSFSRVFQAGHSAGGYQPETVSVIFERAMFGKDVATGKVDLATTLGYSSRGESNIRGVKSELPDLLESVCYVLAPGGTCTDEQLKALENGTAETKDFVVTNPPGTKGQRLKNVDNGKGGNDTDTGDSGSSLASTLVSGGWMAAALPILALFIV